MSTETAEHECYPTAGRPVVSVDTRPEDECTRADCRQIAATASDVYCEITGGKLSYPTYDARTILSEAGDYTQQLIDAEVADETEGLRSQLRDARAENEQWQARLTEHADCELRNAAELRELRAENESLTELLRVADAERDNLRARLAAAEQARDEWRNMHRAVLADGYWLTEQEKAVARADRAEAALAAVGELCDEFYQDDWYEFRQAIRAALAAAEQDEPKRCEHGFGEAHDFGFMASQWCPGPVSQPTEGAEQ